MSVMNEMPYRRSKRAEDATGSLVFDQERNKHRETGEMPKHTVYPDHGRSRPD
jgi:hypothetical protein